MIGRRLLRTGLLAVVLAGGAMMESRAQLDSFSWVDIGNPGNPADSYFGGVGSVDYTFRMSSLETTNLQWVHFLNTVDPNGTNPNGLYNANMASNAQGGITFDSAAAAGSKYAAKSGYGLLPVVYVSWNDAARFVNWLHNGAGPSSSTETGVYDMSLPQQERVRMAGARYWLPNEDEWHKAAYYDPTLNGGTGGYYLYPTQSNTVPTSTSPNDTNANSANFYSGSSYADPKAGDPSGTLFLTEVGGYEAAGSYYGTFDQGGNVWEWTERINGSSRGLRGGSWGTFLDGDNLSASYRNDNTPALENGLVGFRVASVPEPSTAMLMLLGGAAYLLAKRRRNTL